MGTGLAMMRVCLFTVFLTAVLEKGLAGDRSRPRVAGDLGDRPPTSNPFRESQDRLTLRHLESIWHTSIGKQVRRLSTSISTMYIDEDIASDSMYSSRNYDEFLLRRRVRGL